MRKLVSILYMLFLLFFYPVLVIMWYMLWNVPPDPRFEYMNIWQCAAFIWEKWREDWQNTLAL